jgi:hypothetical protein
MSVLLRPVPPFVFAAAKRHPGIYLESVGPEVDPPPLRFVPYDVSGRPALRWWVGAGGLLRRTWPRWVSAVAASSVLVGSGFAYVASAEVTPHLSAGQQVAFIGQCERGAGWTASGCRCLLTQLTANGYDTPSSLNAVMADARHEAVSGQSGLASTTLARAAQTCLAPLSTS